MHKMQWMNVVNRRSDNMRYFCSFTYVEDGETIFGNAIYNSDIDPYENIGEFMINLRSWLSETEVFDAILLNYKRVM